MSGPSLRADVLTVFPEYLAPLDLGLLGRARRAGRLDLRVHDLRAWTTDVHHSVDDAPYGGGPGMVMTPGPWWAALSAVSAGAGARPRVVVLSPSGTRLDQAAVERLAQEPWLVLCCGRYEGIDQRVVDHWADEVISIGDYVLHGGEVAALVLLEAVTRLVPGVLGNAGSAADDSFAAGLLEGPVYTRPDSYEGRPVPAVLLSGDHAAIARWRRDQALVRTAAVRPDLLAGVALDARDQAVLDAGAVS